MSEAKEDDVKVFECEKVVNKVKMLSILSVFPSLQSHMAKLRDITSLETAMGPSDSDINNLGCVGLDWLH